MVVVPNHCDAGFSRSANSYDCRLGNLSFYLHSFLMKISDIETYKTINVLAVALLIAFLFSRENIFLFLAVILLVNNIIFIEANRVIADYWLAFAKVVGNINSKIILTIIFFLFLTPIAFLYRIFNREQVANFKVNNRESYFEDVSKEFGKEDFLKQW